MTNPYTEIVDDALGDRESALRSALYVGSKAPPPATVARGLSLAQQTQLPPDVAIRNPDRVAQAADQSTPDYGWILDEAPGLATWLTDPHNAALGRHELDSLARVDQSAQTIAAPRTSGFFGAIPTGYNDLAASAGQLAAAFGIAAPERAAAFVAERNKAAADLRARAPEYAKAYDAAQSAAAKRAVLYQAIGQGTPGAPVVGEVLDRLAVALTHPRGFARSLVEGLVGSAPALITGTAGAAAGSLVPGPGTAIGLGVGTFAGLAPTAIGQEVNAELQKRGVDVTDPAALLRAYRDPQLMAFVRRRAEAKGLTSSAVSSIVASVAGQLTAGARVAGGTPAQIARAAAADVGIQAAGQATANVTGQIAGGEPVDVGQAIDAGLAQLGFGLSDVAIGGGLRGRHAPETHLAAAEIVDHATEALRAQHDAQALHDLAEATREAPATASVPDRLRQLIETASGGREAATIYFRPDEWSSYWQSQQESPAAKAAEIVGDDGHAFTEAQATGAPLAIPLGDYVSKIGEHADGLLPIARTAPDGMSLGEAQHYLTQLPATLKAIVDEAQQPAPGTPEGTEAASAAAASATEVGADVARQVEAAGRSATEAAQARALYESAFRTLGQRTGIDPLELYHRYALAVQHGTDEAVAASAPSEANAAAPSLDQAPIDRATATPEELKRANLEALIGPTPEGSMLGDDEGKAVRSLFAALPPDQLGVGDRTFDQPAYHGSPHIFDEFSLHKIGTGEGVQSFGWGLYFAGKKDIAQHYRDVLAHARASLLVDGVAHSRSTLIDGAARETFDISAGYRDQALLAILDADGDRAAAQKRADLYAAMPTADRAHFTRLAEAIRALPESEFGVKSSGRLYSVDIPNDDTMLHWEQPIGTQPEMVQRAVHAAWEQFADHAKLGGGVGAKMTGETIYTALTRPDEYGRPYNSPEVVSRYLADRGVTGIKYLDATSRAKGEGSHNYVVFDDKLVKIMDFEQAQSTGAARGRIQFARSADGGFRANIDLFDAADRSTFLHESGHFYLELLHDLARAPDAAPEITADLGTVRTWLGAEGDAPLTRAQHEQFARGFEAYLMEGKAPSLALRRTFRRFKDWLVALYQHTGALNVEVTPAVRAVFDRLLATKQEIAEAEAQASVTPLFPDPRAVGLTDEQATIYQRALDDAHGAAEDRLVRRRMASLRREESAEWKTLRKPVHAEVAAEVAQHPVYRALALLTKGTDVDGAPLPEGTLPLKLDRDAIVREYGEDAAKALPPGAAVEPMGSEHAFVLHPDVAAETLGFRDGRELMAAITHAPKRSALVDLLTDERMREEHGDRLSDATLREQASVAVRSEERSAVLRTEMRLLASDHLHVVKGLAKAIARPVPPLEAVRAEAERLVGTRAVRDLRPDLLEKAAARASREAMEALFTRNDVAAAFDAKSRELLATEMFRAAARAKDEIAAGVQDFRKVFRPDAKVGQTRDLSLVAAARQILVAFGIGSGHTDRAEKALDQLAAYDPQQFAVVQAEIQAATTTARGDYRKLSVDQFRALHESVESLWRRAAREKQIAVDGVRVQRDVVVADLVEHLTPRVPAGVRPGERAAVTPAERAGAKLASAGALLRRVEHWVREMDEGADNGPFRRYVWNGVKDAESEFVLRKAEEVAKHRADVERLRPTISSAKIDASEIGYTFAGKNELLGALLHVGNPSNLRKLLLGRGWATERETGDLDTVRWQTFVDRMQKTGVLTKTDYDFVQAVWDHFETLKPEAQRAYREQFGHYFDEVTAAPVDTPFGQYRGGYYPAKTDPFITPLADRRASAETLLQGEYSGMFPSTGRGFTKARVEYNRPLLLDASAVPLHLDAQLRFTILNRAVTDVARLLRDRRFADVLDQVDRHAIGELLDPWLQRVAQQATSLKAKTAAGRAINDFAGMLRTRASMQILAASLTTASEQITHMPALKTRVAAPELARGLWLMTRQPKETVRWVQALSPYMRGRESAGFMEAREAINTILLDPSVIQRGSQWVRDHGTFLSRAIQHVEDHVAWAGAYSDGVKQGMESPAAVRHADAIVREIMGAYEPSALSRFEAGYDAQKLISMFVGFFITKANQLKTDAATTLRADLGFRSKATKLAGLYTFGFLLPAVLAASLKRATNGQPIVDTDGDGTDWSDVFRLFFGSQLESAARMVPIVGPSVEYAVQHATGDRTQDIVTSPALSLLESALRAPGDAVHAIHSRLSRAQVTDIFTLLGLATGTPARTLAKPINYVRDINSGAARARGPIDFARGLLTGATGGP